jgi:hypothetical protein
MLNLGQQYFNRNASSSKANYWIIGVILVSALGPYIPGAGGLRVEHLAIYGISLVSFFKWISSRYYQRCRPIGVIVLLLFCSLLWTGFVSYFHSRPFDGSVVAAIENFLQPIALIIVISVALKGNVDEMKRLLLFCCVFISVLLSINSLVALFSVYFDIWPIVRYFVGDSEKLVGWTVWSNAIAMGRYPGLFNQPLECGLAHSIGVLSWIYYVSREKRLRYRDVFIFMGVSLGGFLSVSKVFLLGGLPLAVIYWFWCKGMALSSLFVITIISSLMAGVIIVLSSDWAGYDRMTSYFSVLGEDVDSVAFYTAGRFGADKSNLMRLFDKTWENAPLFGFGFGAFFGIAADNAYIEFFYQGGLVALGLYIGVVVVIGAVSLQAVRQKNAEGKILVLILILIIGAGIGSPVLTLNRASIFIWVLIVCIITICCCQNSMLKTNVGK